jgi:hypothetical protein
MLDDFNKVTEEIQDLYKKGLDYSVDGIIVDAAADKPLPQLRDFSSSTL